MRTYERRRRDIAIGLVILTILAALALAILPMDDEAMECYRIPAEEAQKYAIPE